MTQTEDYFASLKAWRQTRLQRLKAADGWLTIVGRWPLDVGTATVGSGQGNDIVLPTGPERLGTLLHESSGVVIFTSADGAPPTRIEFDKDRHSRFSAGGLLLEIMTVGQETSLRVRDPQSTAPERLAPIEVFPADPRWRIVADWVPYGQAQQVTVGTTKDIDTEVEVTHKAVFTLDGRKLELIATHGTPEAPQFVIRDLTSRDSTYPAARFVYGEEVTGQSIVLDFNKAINPPCAFTDFAVCPLPPPENVLPVRIEAGEKWPH